MDAQFVWSDAENQGRNRFTLLRRVVQVRGEVSTAVLHLFVDNRYRVRVNGQVAGYGPLRFVPSAPEYDSIDLAPYLVPGGNVILIEAWSPGANNFQAMKGSRAGIIAWGAVSSLQEESLLTPGAWRAHSAGMWDAESPAFSFAQGPVEILDGRQLPAAWLSDPAAALGTGWGAPVPVTQPHWGPLAVRSLPLLDLRVDSPVCLLQASVLGSEEEVLGGRTVATQARQAGLGRIRFPYALCIHSPRLQEVTLGTFWGPNYLNGVELPGSNDPLLGNRQNAQLALRAGWNLLYGEPEALTDVWGVLLALPRAAGLQLRCRDQLDAPVALLIGEAASESALALARGAVPVRCGDLERLPFRWRESREAMMPAREVAWDRAGANVLRSSPAEPLSLPAKPHVLVYDLGCEALGHPLIELSAPAGTIIDLALDERLRQDGQLALFASNPFTDTVDRIISDGTRRTWEGFHPRGGRFLQITLRPPAGSGGLIQVHQVGMRSGGVPVPFEARFRCSDPVLSWGFATGVATLRACIEDAFLDCPWRERGTYLGDALVEARALAAASSDLAVAWRTATVVAQAQLPDGQMQGCAPSWLEGPMGDFSLIWVLMLRDLWAASGEVQRLRGLWPAAERVLASSRWSVGEHGLWRAEQPGIFVDWGAPAEAKTGENASLNAFRIRALQCMAEMAQALGRSDAVRYRAEAEHVAGLFRTHFWREQQGLYAASLASEAGGCIGLHASVLALAFGLASPAQAPRLLASLLPLFARNALRATATEENEYLELYFLHYAVQGLYEHQQALAAERLLRAHCLPQQRAGAWTLWEGLRWGSRGQASLCHAWSATPTWVAREHILGVRPVHAGEPDHVLIAPDSHLAWAEGVVPHPRGLISVAWRREGSVLVIETTLPEGVSARCQPGPAFAGCSVVERWPISGPARVAHA